MTPEVGAYAQVGGVAAVVTFLLTPLMRRLSYRIGAVVAPDERRVHTVPTPILGGAAMMIGLAAGLAAAWRIPALEEIFRSNTEPLGLLLAGVFIFAVGTLDDLREVSAPARTAATVVSASILVTSGISILVFRIPFGGLWVLSADWSFLLSVLWVLGMTQAVNLIDGLDGLAGGIVAIAASTFFLYALRLADEELISPSNPGPLFAILVFGICIGFLPWNVHPAKIFMGDAGAYLLGLLMAASTMVVGGRNEQEFSGQVFFFFAPLFIPLFILGVPILDTAFSIIRRAVRRQGVTTADKDHLHHRLLRLGHGHRRSVLILWAWSALLSGFVLYPAYTGNGDAIVPLAAAAMGLALFTVFHPILTGGADPERGERLAAKGGQAAALGGDDASAAVAGERDAEPPVVAHGFAPGEDAP